MAGMAEPANAPPARRRYELASEETEEQREAGG